MFSHKPAFSEMFFFNVYFYDMILPTCQDYLTLDFVVNYSRKLFSFFEVSSHILRENRVTIDLNPSIQFEINSAVEIIEVYMLFNLNYQTVLLAI